MFNVCSLTHVLRTLNSIHKMAGGLVKHTFFRTSVKCTYEKNYFNGWVVICKLKAFRGMVKCVFLITCVKSMFLKTHV